MYVDDILLPGNNKEMIVATQGWLSSKFETKDMGEASYVLRVKILRDRSRRLLNLSQETYIKKVLERFQIQACKPVDTPVKKGSTLNLRCSSDFEEKREDGPCSLFKRCWKPDVRYDVYSTRHLPRSWPCQSIPSKS